MRSPVFASLILALLLTACTSSGVGGTDVTRFHLGLDIPAQPVSFEAADPAMADSLEFATYRAAVAAELARLGFEEAEADSADLIARIGFGRGMRVQPARRSPFSVGIGAGSFGGNVGVGGSVNMPVGGDSGGEAFVTELEVMLIRRSEMAVSWEGRAVSRAPANNSSAAANVQQLTAALFSDFPGASGQTVTVR